jgi:hypothetical protein
VLLALLLGSPARGEEAGYGLESAVLLFWEVGITADDGATSSTDIHTFFCCAEADAVVFGDAAPGAEPTFTPQALTHLLRPDPVAGLVGVNPIGLDLAGALTWSPASEPSLTTGESGPMETGPLTAAEFRGTLSTPFGEVPIGHGLSDHVGGDTRLRRYSGGADLGPPRLRASAVLEPLDRLEVDEGDVAGRVEMANPYEAVLGTLGAGREAGSVSYPLASAAGLYWELTLSADDGVAPPASDTVFALAGAGATLQGTIRGIVAPVFTPASLVHSLDAAGIEFQVGALPVTLALSGSLTWSPPAGPSLASGEAAPMPTGDATGASFQGWLATPVGILPFVTGLADHGGGDLGLTRVSGGADLGPPRLRIGTSAAPLDQLEIDEFDQAGRVEMRSPYQVVLGTMGAITWSLSARALFNDAYHGLLPSAPNGELRAVTWSLHSELFFNDAFYAHDPLLTSTPPRVPVLGGLGRALLGALLLAGGLAVPRFREDLGLARRWRDVAAAGPARPSR